VFSLIEGSKCQALYSDEGTGWQFVSLKEGARLRFIVGYRYKNPNPVVQYVLIGETRKGTGKQKERVHRK